MGMVQRDIRLLVLLAINLLAGCSWSPSQPENPPSSDASWANWGDPSPVASSTPSPGDEIVHVARSLLGTPYRYGGASPRGFDCSGLVHYTFSQTGLRVPRTSREQYRKSRPVPLDAARPGDLVFFSSGKKISHVGIYIGDSRFIHAPDSGQQVKISNLGEDYYRANFVGAGRLE
jgi:cell wall-associated NlpC family hydrolase